MVVIKFGATTQELDVILYVAAAYNPAYGPSTNTLTKSPAPSRRFLEDKEAFCSSVS